MEESEAIEKLKNMRLFMQIIDKNSKHKFTEDDYTTNEMAIKALEEVQQYREIGTLEECRTAKEKQMSKKPNFTEDKTFALCPCCNGKGLLDKQKYCDNCGQKLDWSEESEE
jgi:hypothetical protein